MERRNTMTGAVWYSAVLPDTGVCLDTMRNTPAGAGVRRTAFSLTANRKTTLTPSAFGYPF